jgi:hypothetical protein
LVTGKLRNKSGRYADLDNVHLTIVVQWDIIECRPERVAVAFALDLPAPLDSEGWKVKIRDKERLEPPHVTILHRTRIWRLGLRNGEFLVPPGGKWKEIDPRVKAAIEAMENWQRLCDEWDSAYPTNPVVHVEEDDGE